MSFWKLLQIQTILLLKCVHSVDVEYCKIANLCVSVSARRFTQHLLSIYRD